MLEHGGIGRPARSGLPSTRFHSGAAVGYWQAQNRHDAAGDPSRLL